jgi:hypothetical protein
MAVVKAFVLMKGRVGEVKNITDGVVACFAYVFY